MQKKFFSLPQFFITSFVLGVLFVAFRLFPIFLGKTILFGDNFSLIVPGKLFSAEWLSKGVLPFWNSEIFAGIRWLADINQSVLYPTTGLFMIFSPAVALNTSIFIHLVWTFVGMSMLAKKWLKNEVSIYFIALLWTISPTMIGTLNNLSTLQSLAWTPWVVLGCVLIRRKYGILWLSFAVFGQFLGGYPQHVLYALIAGVVLQASEYFFSTDQTKKNFFSFITVWLIAAFAVVLSTAVLWMPFLDVLKNSTRVLQTTEQAASGSLAPIELIKIIFPQLFENALLGMKWGPLWNGQPNIFLYFSWFGLFVILLFLIRGSKRALDWGLVGLLIFSCLMAFGENLPGFSLLQSIPILNSSRGASTVLMIGVLAGVLLVGRSVDWLVAQDFKISKVGWVIVGISTLAFFAGFVALLNFEFIWKMFDQLINLKLSSSAFHTITKDKIIFESILVSSFVSFAALVLSFIFWQQKKYGWLLIILAIELNFHTQSHVFFGPNSLYSKSTTAELSKAIDSMDLDNYRVLTRNYNTPYADFGAYLDALTVRSPFSDSYITSEELENFTVLDGMKTTVTPNWNMVYGVPVIHGYTTLVPASLHRSFFPSEAEYGINRMPEIYTTNSQLSNWAVKYYLVDNWFPVYGEPIPNKLVASSGRIDIYEIENVLPRFRNTQNEPKSVWNIRETPNTLQFIVEGAENETLLVADRYDRNWRAKINGVTTEVADLDGQRAVKLQPGTNSIEFWFFPTQVYKGIILSLLGFLMAGLTVASQKISSLFS